MKTLITAIVVTLVTLTSAYSKAYFQTETELVSEAVVIAIIDLAEPKDTEQQGGIWVYRKSASAKVVETLKGDIPQSFILHGNETFICAHCGLAAGRYLAFLRRDGALWSGSNWQLSLRPVKGGQIEWYIQPSQRHPMKFQPSEMVLQRVRQIIASPPSRKGT